MEFDLPCSLVRVVDGDTVWLRVDQGFYNYHDDEFRLWGINTAELNRGTDEEKAKGKEAKAFVIDWFKRYANQELRVTIGMKKTRRDIDKYGRWIADIYFKEKISGKTNRLSDELVYRDLAVPFMDDGYYIGTPKEQLNTEENAALDTPTDS